MITLKTADELALMRKASTIVAEILEELAGAVRPGITTFELDKMAEELTYKKGAKPAFKGYTPGDVPYPKTLCVAVNDVIVHGIPSTSQKLKQGDIIGLDFGVCYEGFYGDSARTLPVGKVSPGTEKLLRVTREALYKAIEQCRVGNRISDVANAVQCHAESNGFSVVEEFAGHGIGRRLHEEPSVPNYFRRGMPNPRLLAGMVIAIEPMVNEGTPRLRILKDGWTAVTADGKLSAHFEHSVAITDNGPEILSELDHYV